MPEALSRSRSDVNSAENGQRPLASWVQRAAAPSFAAAPLNCPSAAIARPLASLASIVPAMSRRRLASLSVKRPSFIRTVPMAQRQPVDIYQARRNRAGQKLQDGQADAQAPYRRHVAVSRPGGLSDADAASFYLGRERENIPSLQRPDMNGRAEFFAQACLGRPAQHSHRKGREQHSGKKNHSCGDDKGHARFARQVRQGGAVHAVRSQARTVGEDIENMRLRYAGARARFLACH